MHIHYLMHHPDEGLGIINQWILNKGYSTSVTRLYEKSFVLPQIQEFDALVIMGGPQSVYEEDKFEWLKVEKHFIDLCVKADKKILGICFGAQLLAEILGGRVYPNTQKEIGWFDISLTTELKSMLGEIDDHIKVFHWHGDTFTLPEGAVRLASSPVTVNQGFIYNNNIIALQFHFEVDEKAIKGMNSAFDHELVKAEYVQTDVEIKSQIHLVEGNNNLMYKLLDFFIG